MASFHLVNAYGLFRVMTTQRPEIEIEFSGNGIDWTPIEFRYKAGDPRRAPPWVAPHQPRLDWQMWFAAMDSYADNVWFENLLVRLLERSPSVWKLVRTPMPEASSIRYVRATLYDYAFATPAEKQTSGQWWVRRPIRNYSPVLKLQ